ncbi:unnamed protein product [Miscanthus lutarioriparius]|uniref:Uncharacterized protein n=1 Tax=Miscanthus lutarioriparius TaxID=422564 RepID=A0A811QP10_9POAL|nr:unnamed protein product [Miscanthus lutarioriparius]
MAAPLRMTTTAALRLIKVYVSTWHFRNHDPLKLNEMMEATYLQLGVRLKKIACQCLCDSPIWMVPKNYQVCCCDWLGFFGLQVQDSKMQKLSLHVRSLRPPWPSGSTPWAPLFSSTTPNNFESKVLPDSH